MQRGFGIAREGADAGESARLEKRAVPAPEQVGMGLEVMQHLDETTGGEAVTATYARAFLQMDGVAKPVADKHLVRDLPRLLEADGCTQAMCAHLEEDLVCDVVVRREEQLGEDFPKGRDWR